MYLSGLVLGILAYEKPELHAADDRHSHRDDLGHPKSFVQSTKALNSRCTSPYRMRYSKPAAWGPCFIRHRSFFNCALSWAPQPTDPGLDEEFGLIKPRRPVFQSTIDNNPSTDASEEGEACDHDGLNFVDASWSSSSNAAATIGGDIG